MSAGQERPSSTTVGNQGTCQQNVSQAVAGNDDHVPYPDNYDSSRSDLNGSSGSESGSGYDEESQESYSEPLPYEQDSISKHEVGWRRVVRNFAPS